MNDPALRAWVIRGFRSEHSVSRLRKRLAKEGVDPVVATEYLVEVAGKKRGRWRRRGWACLVGGVILLGVFAVGLAILSLSAREARVSIPAMRILLLAGGALTGAGLHGLRRAARFGRALRSLRAGVEG